jgi:hypothetical protein
MQFAELLVGLFAAAVALTWLARRVNVPYPVILVLGGALWQAGGIGDEVLHEIERELDVAESLLG